MTSRLWFSIVVIAVLASSLVSARRLRQTQNPFCVITGLPNNQTIDLNPLLPAKYNATLVSGSNVMESLVNFVWCGADFNSTVCNATGLVMTIESSATCVTSMEIWAAPATAAGNAISFSLWNGDLGTEATVTVQCDPKGAQGKATLLSPVTQSPAYEFTFIFSSVHACAQNA